MSHQNITFSEEKQAKFLDIGRPSVTGIGQPCYHHWGITGIKGNMAIIVKQIGQRGTCAEKELLFYSFFLIMLIPDLRKGALPFHFSTNRP